MRIFKSLIGQSKNKKETGAPASSPAKFNKVVLYTCIAFFVITAVFVGFSYGGRWQAGLIEVCSSAFLFVLSLHILKIVIPESSGKIILALSVIIAVMFVYANFSLQRSRHQEYSFKEFLVGDLLVNKLIGKDETAPEKLLKEKLKVIIPGEFAQTKTEKDTIVSSFEKPKKDVMGEPVILSVSMTGTVIIPVLKGGIYPISIPEETTRYTFVVAGTEGLRTDNARMVMTGLAVPPDKTVQQTSAQHSPAPLYLPSETGVDDSLIKHTIYGNSEQPAAAGLESVAQPLSEEDIEGEAGKQLDEKLHIQ